jgi:hypothetical protein
VHRIVILIFLTMAAVLVRAETNGPPQRGPVEGWSPLFRGGAVYHAATDLDRGGRFSVSRYYLEGGMAYLFRRDRMVSLSVGYGQDDYRFSGIDAGPWNNIVNYRAGLFSRWGLDEKWTLFAVPSLRSYGEPGAKFSDTLSAAFFGGVSRRFGNRLTLGPGLGVVGQLEDRPRYFPVLIVQWNITDQLRLETGGGLAASAGPGLTLSYHFSSHWYAGVSARYEKRRFRLDDEGILPDGVGEDRNIPVLFAISHVLYPGTEFGAIIGVNYNGKISADNENGNNVYKSEYDNSMFYGLAAKIRI